MPPTQSKDERKRKRKELEGAAAKKKPKATSVSDESDDEGDDAAQSKILLLESGILESKKNYNNITTLVGLAKNVDGNEETATLASVALCRIFVRLLASGSLTYKKSLPKKDAVRVEWLKARFADYKNVLVSLLVREDHVASTALTLAMKVMQAEGRFLQEKDFYVFPKAFLEQIVRSLIETENEDAPSEFLQNFADEFDDLRFYTHQAIRNIISNWPTESGDLECFDQIFDLMVVIDSVPGSNEELEDFYIPKPTKKSHPLLSLVQHKKQAQEAWLALLGLRLDATRRKRVLGIMTTAIAPWFATPELLADFLTDCYDAGGATSVLALSGVFYLIQNCNIDYPSFYVRLYALLADDRDGGGNVLHSRHRARFLRLLDTFLSSSHLPATLVASFAKRLARLCLSAPPAAVVFAVPWTYNLLRRHPKCTFMLHRELRTREERENAEIGGGFEDPFDPDERDPLQTGALESCLWEFVQLQSHYHPNVATIAKILGEQFTKQQYNIEDFLDHSYASLLDAEWAKGVKKAPPVEYFIPKRVFLPHDEGSEVPDSLFVKLWDFSSPGQS